jgi:hypothetical protein
MLISMDQVRNESWGTTMHNSLSYITSLLVDLGDLAPMMERAMRSKRGIGDLCHTLFRERGNEASIRVPRMFNSHV